MARDVLKTLLEWIQSLTSMTCSWSWEINNRSGHNRVHWLHWKDSHILWDRVEDSEKVSSSKTQMTQSAFLTFPLWLQKSEKNSKSQPNKNETKRMLNESETENISRNTWSQSDNGRKQQHESRCVETMFQQMKFKSDSKNGSRKKQNNSLSLTFYEQ